MSKKEHLMNLAIQVLPVSKTRRAYDIIDDAIKVIMDSGVKYVVCPFETVMEGTCDQLMKIVREVHNICHEKGAEEVIINIKIQSRRDRDVFIEDKINKYKT